MRRVLRKIVQVLDGTPAEYGRPQRGQSLVEMAFITPILIIMVAGIVEIGWFAQNYLNLIESAKVGARRGPFLNAENSPQEWPVGYNGANLSIGPSLAPRVVETITGEDLPDIDAPDTELEDYRDATVQPDHYLRYNYRNCNAEEQYFGFFNLVACTVIDSLDPLQLKIGDNCFTYFRGDGDDAVACKDDVVVSAFALQRVNNGVAANSDINLNNPPNGATNSKTYPAGHQVIVVGRYPQDANECQGGGNSLDGRDPFDYIQNGQSDVWYAPNPLDPTTDVRLELELIKSFNEDSNVTIEFRDSGPERQRGFAWTGQHVIQNDAGIECYGSEWDIDTVERLMNLPGFIDDDANAQERLQYLPSQGIVIVEIFWQHSLLLANASGSAAFPIWSAAYGLFSSSPDAEVIYVWAAFPAPSAQPNILYKLN